MTKSLLGQPYYFQDYTLGEAHLAGTHHVSKSEIIDFASQWDPQPFHIDQDAAEQSVFKGLTACSAHIFSIFCRTSQQWQSGVVQQAVAGLGFDEMRMLKPVYAGDMLSCVSMIDSLRPSNSMPDCGIVGFVTSLNNQNGEQVFSIKAASLIAIDHARRQRIDKIARFTGLLAAPTTIRSLAFTCIFLWLSIAGTFVRLILRQAEFAGTIATP